MTKLQVRPHLNLEQVWLIVHTSLFPWSEIEIEVNKDRTHACLRSFSSQKKKGKGGEMSSVLSTARCSPSELVNV